MEGILLIDKPKDYTSRDVVNVVSKKLNISKVGHTGTLDPLATGVLVLCLGKATKLVELLTSTDKEYEAEVILGMDTDTLDITGNIIKEKEAIFSKEVIEQALIKMTGIYEQEVPKYAAVKVNGKKLYEYARANEDVILPKRMVNIYSLELIGEIKYQHNKTIFSFRSTVSKGTYIRSLIRDIAAELNTVGTMSELRRIKQGDFSLKDCFTLEALQNDSYEIRKMEEVLSNLYTVEVDDFLASKIQNGRVLENRYSSDLIVFKKEQTLLAIYKVHEKDNTKIKPYKMFI